MHDHAQRPAGPDFLASVAEQNLTSGLLENANEFRVRADEWRRDLRTIDVLTDQLARAEARIAASSHALAAN